MKDPQSYGPAIPSGDEPKQRGSGKDLTPVERACELAREAGGGIVSALGAELERRDKLRTIAVFKRTLIPAGRPGRRRKKSITEAHLDWKAGLRPPFLCEKHISGFGKMNQYQRDYEARRLMEAIRTRERRAAKCPT